MAGRGQARSECVAGLGTERERGLDLSRSLTRMEVASALLEASKKLSGSADSSTSSSCSATATWSSSMSEVGPPLMSRQLLLKEIKMLRIHGIL